jgi:hypothetical protein
MLALQNALSSTDKKVTMKLAEDGGYVMIGVPMQNDPSATASPIPFFESVEWSTGIHRVPFPTSIEFETSPANII